jgi:Leucine-rich repeat (LRR) protein
MKKRKHRHQESRFIFGEQLYTWFDVQMFKKLSMKYNIRLLFVALAMVAAYFAIRKEMMREIVYIQEIRQVGCDVELSQRQCVGTHYFLESLFVVPHTHAVSVRTKVGFQKLASTSYIIGRLRYLSSVDLADSDVCDLDIKKIANNSCIRYLSLQNCLVSDSSCDSLSKMVNLRTLSLQNTNITAIGLTSLAASSSLEILAVSAKVVTEQAISILDDFFRLNELHIAGELSTDISAKLKGRLGTKIRVYERGKLLR